MSDQFTREDVTTLLLEVMDWTYVQATRERPMTEAEQKVLNDIRTALAAPSEDIETLRRENERLQNLLYDQMGKVFALRAAEPMRKQIAELKHAENERLRGLLAEAQKAVWMNYDGDLLDRIEAALKEPAIQPAIQPAIRARGTLERLNDAASQSD